MSDRPTRVVLTALLALGGAACADLLGIEERVAPPDAGAGGASASGAPSSMSSGTSASSGSPSTAETGSSSSTGGDGGASSTGGGGAGGRGAACDEERLDDDPANCGACGRDCLGGGCSGGVCQAVEIVAPFASPENGEYRPLNVDPGAGGDVLFARWRPGAAIYRAAKAPGAAPELVGTVADGGWAHDASMDQEWVYWTSYSDQDAAASRGVYARRRAGGDPVQLLRLDPSGAYYGVGFVLARGTDVIFSSLFGKVGLGRTALGGGPPTPLWTFGDDPPYYALYNSTFCVDGDWVYATGLDAVWRHRVDGTGSEQLYPSPDGGVLGVRDGHVYWSGEVVSHGPVDGSGPVETLDHVRDAANKPRIVGDHVYWGVRGGNEIRRLRLDDPDAVAEVIGTSPGFEIREFAADAVSVYWMSYSTGQIFRRAL